MTFADNLRRLRKAAGLSQEALAHACGYPGQSRIANYESKGKSAREPSLEEIPVIAKALGVGIDALFGGSSQSMRLDQEIVQRVANALAKRYRAAGGYNLAERPGEFVRAYELWIGMSDAYTSPDVFDLVISHADLSPQGANDEQRGEGVPASGATGKGVRTGGGR